MKFLKDYADKVVGIDFMKKRIEKARKLWNYENVEFQVGDVTNLKFKDNIFDVYTCDSGSGSFECQNEGRSSF